MIRVIIWFTAAVLVPLIVFVSLTFGQMDRQPYVVCSVPPEVALLGEGDPIIAELRRADGYWDPCRSASGLAAVS